MIQAWSGAARIVGSGTATTFGGNGLYLELSLPERTYAVGITFVEEPEREGVDVRSALLADGLRVECVNFDDRGRGSAQPVLLAELADDLLLFHFRAWRHGRSIDHTVHYTFFRASKAEVGWAPVVRGPGGG